MAQPNTDSFPTIALTYPFSSINILRNQNEVRETITGSNIYLTCNHVMTRSNHNVFYQPGTRHSYLTCWAYKDLKVTVAELDAPTSAEKASPAKLAANALGLTLADLSAAQKRELRQSGGVLVEKVQGPAARCRPRAGRAS